MAWLTVVAMMGTWGAPVLSSSNSAQTASAPPRLLLPLPRGVWSTASSTPSASASSRNSFWNPASFSGRPQPLPLGGRQYVSMNRIARP